jgi:hypothetical protein
MRRLATCGRPPSSPPFDVAVRTGRCAPVPHTCEDLCRAGRRLHLVGCERHRAPAHAGGIEPALEIADGTKAAAGSPAPHGGMVGRSIKSMTISGTSGKVRIG